LTNIERITTTRLANGDTEETVIFRRKSPLETFDNEQKDVITEAIKRIYTSIMSGDRHLEDFRFSIEALEGKADGITQGNIEDDLFIV